MPTEIEAKMKAGDFEAIRALLQRIGAVHVGSVLEINAFFDSADRALVSKDTGLRLRRTRDERTREEHFIITVKGPQQKGELKSREEAEVRVDDGEGAKAVLVALGFEPMLSFEKRRESWTLDDCKIELDELPILGRFVEIEGPNENAVMAVREKLQMSAEPLVKTGYATLLARHLKDSGDSRTSITFHSHATNA